MSINTSIELAFSGLRATQAGLDVVSQNIANAGATGYVRRVLNSEQQVSGDRTTGVQTFGAQRMLNALVQRQARLEQAGASYTATRSDATAALNQLFDKPGGSGSLATLVNTFTTSLQTLANNPTSYPNRTAVLSAASDLSQTLNGLSDQVLAMRQSAENAIGAGVNKADGLLQQIDILSKKVVASPTSAALQDQRDALVDQLSTLMDVKVTDQANGGIMLSTTGGLQLYDGNTPARLSFDQQSISAGSTYSTDPAKRNVGTITVTDGSGVKRDVIASGLIRSGEIAAQIELRDTTLKQATIQLDQLAAGLAQSLSDKAVAGTAATSGGANGFSIDLASLQSGNSFTVAVKDANDTSRTVTFVKATTAAGAAAATSADGSTVGLDFSGGTAAVATQIAAKLNVGYATPGFTVTNPSGSVFQILDDGAAATTDVKAVSGTATATSLAGGSAQLPLFVDGGRNNAVYSGSYDGGSQLAGFAGRIVLNPAAVNDPSTLVVYGTGVQAGDTTRPLFILDALTNADRTFSGQAGIGGSSSPYVGSVTDFAQRIIETQAAAANSAATLNDGQQVVLANVQSRFVDQAGVNIDTEMTQLIQLQTAYSANARILSAAKEMMDMLLRVGG